VKLAKHSGAPRVPFALLVTTLIVGGLALLLLLNTASAANEVHRHNLAEQDAAVAAQVQELGNDVAASAAPGALARAAAELGMVPAGNPAFLVIGTDGSVRVLGSAAPASAHVVAQQAPKRHSTPSKHATPSTSKTKSGSTSAPATGHTSAASTHSTATHTKPQPTPTPTLSLGGGQR
jgi:hypothetical protein